MDGLQKGRFNGSANLTNRMSKKVQDIPESPKLYIEDHVKFGNWN